MGPHVGLGRHAQYLPAVSDYVTLGEGETPLLPLVALARTLGLDRLTAKLETSNPTGSYKDRVAAMSLSLALDRGCRGWIATSSGNAGMAFAAYGARAGLPGFLAVVSTAPLEKHASMVPFGPAVAAVAGVGDGGTSNDGARLFRCVAEAADRHHLFLGITAHRYNPDGMRGVETISYELAEQAPDAAVVYVPAGGGGLLVSVARGAERVSAGCAFVACQPSGCAPIVGALAGGPTATTDRCDTGISALQLPDPPDGAAAVESVTASGGWGVVVDDEEVYVAQQLLAELEGLFVEPAAAITLAALIADVKEGKVAKSDHIVLLLTGAGWKDLRRFSDKVGQVAPVPPDQLDRVVNEWAESMTAKEEASPA